MLYYKKISSPLGEITLRSDGERLTGLWFADDKHYCDKDIQDAQNAELPVFARAEKWLAEYFAGCEPKVNVPLQFTGSDFQKVSGRYCKKSLMAPSLLTAILRAKLQRSVVLHVCRRRL